MCATGTWSASFDSLPRSDPITSMVSPDRARRLALALPDSLEADHHGFPSFRIRGRIFATLPDATHINVMLDEDEIRRVVADHPDCCEEQWWGRKLAAVRVTLAQANEALLQEMLTGAWLRRAPKTLAKRYLDERGS